jgi:uncharacterized protein
VRAVLDTNVLVSGLIWRGPPSSLLACVWRRYFDLITSEEILAELLDMLSRPHLQRRLADRRSKPAEVVEKLRQVAIVAEPADITPPPGLRDLKDLPLFRCAVGGEAKVIVTGDRHVLELKEFAGVSIVTARLLLAAEGW